MIFAKNKISSNHEMIAELLRQTRQDKKIPLTAAAQKTGINLKYLEAIEAASFDKLPAGVYGKNFLREYAGFLGLDAKNIAEQYNQNGGNGEQQDNTALFTQKAPRIQFILSLPRIIKGALIFAVVIICVLYLGYCLNSIIKPPLLNIAYPPDDFITNTRQINIEGSTEAEAEITVNGEIVLADAYGNFSKQTFLRAGVNEIVITAQKKYSRKNIITKKILVNGE